MQKNMNRLEAIAAVIYLLNPKWPVACSSQDLGLCLVAALQVDIRHSGGCPGHFEWLFLFGGRKLPLYESCLHLQQRIRTPFPSSPCSQNGGMWPTNQDQSKEIWLQKKEIGGSSFTSCSASPVPDPGRNGIVFVARPVACYNHGSWLYRALFNSLGIPGIV